MPNTTMNSERILLLDLHSQSTLGSEFRHILTPCLQDGIDLRHEEVNFDEIALSEGEHCSSLVSKHKPILLVVFLSQQQLRFAGGLIESWKRQWPAMSVIAVAEGCDPSELFGLFKHGIADFVIPPLKANEILPRTWRLLQHARQSKTLTHGLKEQLGMRQIIGESPAFLSELKKIPLIARCDASVLITGETGTGKELCAQAIHYLSSRSGNAFVPVNCGAIPFELVENELFGHVRGAYTGAIRSQPGLIQLADNGTLFLDEVDSLPPLAQVKLLRFLQEKEYRPLGSANSRKADARIIAATNNDCDEAVKEGKLRYDLYYRLNIIPLRLPALRERRTDIPLLASHFLNKYATEFDRPDLTFDRDAMVTLSLRDWPGNARELENVVARAIALCEQNVITSQHLCLPDDDGEPQKSFREAKASFVAQFERTYIQKLLIAYHGNITRAARAAHKNRRAFWELIRKHRINTQSIEFKSSLEVR